MLQKIVSKFFVVVLCSLTLSGCIKKAVPTPDEATQYLQQVQTYCQKNGYELLGYAGKTIIKTKSGEDNGAPVVYEWETKNSFNKKTYYVRVGPIFTAFKRNFNPMISVSESRFDLRHI